MSKLIFVNLPVSDLKLATDFYEAIGNEIAAMVAAVLGTTG